jgi:hypothetical protein
VLGKRIRDGKNVIGDGTDDDVEGDNEDDVKDEDDKDSRSSLVSSDNMIRSAAQRAVSCGCDNGSVGVVAVHSVCRYFVSTTTTTGCDAWHEVVKSLLATVRNQSHAAPSISHREPLWIRPHIIGIHGATLGHYGSSAVGQ